MQVEKIQKKIEKALEEEGVEIVQRYWYGPDRLNFLLNDGKGYFSFGILFLGKCSHEDFPGKLKKEYEIRTKI